MSLACKGNFCAGEAVERHATGAVAHQKHRRHVGVGLRWASTRRQGHAVLKGAPSTQAIPAVGHIRGVPSLVSQAHGVGDVQPGGDVAVVEEAGRAVERPVAAAEVLPVEGEVQEGHGRVVGTQHVCEAVAVAGGVQVDASVAAASG
eukprot:scaffold1954_cov268-Pinguiococcus_pyrenoidosus.AAC.244